MSKTTILYKDVAPGAEEAAAVATDSASAFSEPSLLPAGVSVSPAATLELGYWGLDGQHIAGDKQQPAFWSSTISGADGTFADPPVIDISFNAAFASLGITILFDTGTGEFCDRIHIDWYRQDTVKASEDFSPDNASYYCEKKVIGYTRIVVTLKRTSIPGRYAKVERIIFGTYRSFGMSEIWDGSVTNQMHPIAAELPVSSLTWTLESRRNVEYMFQLKQPVEVRNDGNLIGVYYIDTSKRSSKNIYQISCSDALGVLGGDNFPGGVYTSYSAKKLLGEIIGRDFPLTVEAEDAALTGILQPCTRREAIQQVLFAWGVCASTDGTDGIRVLSLGTVPEVISQNRVYLGATAETAAIVTEVRVTAHSYTASADGGVEINGQRYADTKTVYTVQNPDVTATDKKNVVTVEEATLISPDIGQAAAQRVYDYYQRRTTNRTTFVWAGERLGGCVTVPTPWGTTETGNLLKMELKLSNTVAVNCEVLS